MIFLGDLALNNIVGKNGCKKAKATISNDYLNEVSAIIFTPKTS